MRCSCQGLKKEILTQIQGLFVSSAEIINPSTESSCFRLEVACPSGPGDQQGCQRWLTLRPFGGAASPVQGRGEWACFLFIGSDFSGRGLFVYSARPMPRSLPWPRITPVGPASGVSGAWPHSAQVSHIVLMVCENSLHQCGNSGPGL